MWKDNFLSLLPESASGIVTIFNLADTKRRNSFLGHLQVDKDIEKFESTLEKYVALDGAVLRIGGDKWAIFLPEQQPSLEKIISEYAQISSALAGWQCLAKSISGETKTSKAVKPTQIQRAVYCVYVEIYNKADAVKWLEKIYEATSTAQINTPLNLAKLDVLLVSNPKQKRWQCLEHDVAEYSCPFCHSKHLDWNDGGWGVFSESGKCKNCQATVDFSEFIEVIVA